MENTSVKLDHIKNIHMIGIGGSGMFSIAKVLLEKGFNITGSDSSESETTEKVRNLGIKLSIGHYSQNIGTPDLVVFSAAIKSENPEIQEAHKRNIPCIERSVMLGLIVNKYKTSIAISGTHGKTSTTSIITHVLLDSGKDPTAIIGGTLPRINGNSCTGNSDIIVCEACEYVNSFLELNPSISIVLNVDADHLDYFKDIQGVKSSFAKFVNLTKDLAIVNGDDKNAVEISKGSACRKLFYGLSEKNDYYAKNITFNNYKYPSFDMFHGETKITHIDLSIPGKHNIYNSLAAAVACIEAGVSADKISNSIKTFKGVHRRFEILEQINKITIADDFAHHPTEIKATLSAAKEMNFKRVIVVFQPHTFSRTFTFLNEFAETLSLADKVILTDILPVRETNTFNIHSEDLAKKIKNCVCVNTFLEAAELISKIASPEDLVLTMGGGNIYQCADMIISKLKNQAKN